MSIQHRRVDFGLDHQLAEEERLDSAATALALNSSLQFPLHSASDFIAWQMMAKDILTRLNLAQVLEATHDGSRDRFVRYWLLQQLPDRQSWLDSLQQSAGRKLWKRRQPDARSLVSSLFESTSSRGVWMSIEACVPYLPNCAYFKSSSKPFKFIRGAAEQGCEKCQFVMTTLSALGSRAVERDLIDELQYITVRFTENSIDVSAKERLFPYFEDYRRLEISVFQFREAPRLSAFTSSIIHKASSLLRDCVGSHARCAPQNSNFLPRRVIDVGAPSRNAVLTESMPQGSKYAALSYCWGQAKDTLVTNRANIGQHFKFIDCEALPKTISDAIIVCRCLQIPYLWVDAICIIQDDVAEQDWYEQSLQMGSIYSHAHVVISAETPSSCTEGFLPSITGIVTNSSTGSRKRKGSQEPGSFAWKRVGRSTQASALAQRGWTIQEIMLPRRVLHFADHEVIWECESACVCECGRTAEHELWKHVDFRLRNNFVRDEDSEQADHIHVTDFLHKSSADSLCWVWERLVELYSSRTLTMPADKLPALAGLARTEKAIMKADTSDYLAGIWRASLPAGLLWHVTGKPKPSRPRDWRAPSWSWASVDGGIGFFRERYQFVLDAEIEILEAVCHPTSVDPFGRLRQGWITLRGALTPVILKVSHREVDSAYFGQYVGCNGKPSRAFPELDVKARLDAGRLLEILPDVRMNEGLYKLGFWCLYIGRMTNKGRRGMRDSWLLLRRCLASDKHGTNESSKLFKRVGIGMLDFSEELAIPRQSKQDGVKLEKIVLV